MSRQFPGSLVGPIFADQIEVTIRHHALESGCFVVNATGWLTEEQIAKISPDGSSAKRPARRLHDGDRLAGGRTSVPPLTEGEGMLVADLDMALITKRKRMMDSVGHYARPELLPRCSRSPGAPMHQSTLDAFLSTAEDHPMKPILAHDTPRAMPTEQLINELQSFGVRLVDPKAGDDSRRGGAGPSDHKADDHRRRDRHGAGAHRAGIREPVCRREARCARAAARSAATAS